jgi:hypothetical protein
MEGVTDIFVLDETFDQLVGQAIINADEAAFELLKTHLAAVGETGQVQQVMEMAMTLGAMACLHPHLEDIAEEIGETYVEMDGSQPHRHDLGSDEDKHESQHDAKKCEDCKAGKRCRRK